MRKRGDRFPPPLLRFSLAGGGREKARPLSFFFFLFWRDVSARFFHGSEIDC